MGGQHLTHAFPKPNAQSVLLAVTSDDDLVVVLQELPCLAARQLQSFGSAPAQFQQGSVRVWGLAGDCSGGHQVTRTKVAASDRVVGDLLQRCPVQVLEVRLGDSGLVLVGG